MCSLCHSSASRAGSAPGVRGARACCPFSKARDLFSSIAAARLATTICPSALTVTRPWSNAQWWLLHSASPFRTSSVPDSSTGIMCAASVSLLPFGDVILLPHNAHRSAYSSSTCLLNTLFRALRSVVVIGRWREIVTSNGFVTASLISRSALLRAFAYTLLCTCSPSSLCVSPASQYASSSGSSGSLHPSVGCSLASLISRCANTWWFTSVLFPSVVGPPIPSSISGTVPCFT